MDRSELWRFYHESGFFSGGKMRRLGREFSTVEKTWDRLLAADESLVWCLNDRNESGEIRSSCVAYRHTPSTRILQHWVSHRSPLGTMRTILETVRRYAEPRADVEGIPNERYLRTCYRPANPLGVRLFRSLYELFPGAGADDRYYDNEVLRIASGSSGSPPTPALSLRELHEMRPRLREELGRVEWEAESLDGDDPLLIDLSRSYAEAGLVRERAIFPLYEPDGSGESRRLMGIVLAEMSSFGLSLSGFNNCARVFHFSESHLAAAVASLLPTLRRFYAARNIPEFCLMTARIGTIRVEGDGIEHHGSCHLATLDLSREYAPMVARHIRAFYEARIGMAGLVTDLSEEEVDWINETGQRMMFQPGEALIHEGEIADCIFVIQAGEVGVFRGEGANRVQLAICRAPDVLGEVGILQAVKRTASVVALTPVVALRLSRKRLGEFTRIFPEGGEALEKALKRRMENERQMTRWADSVRPAVEPAG